MSKSLQVENQLATRYASKQIIQIFDLSKRFVLEREFWIEVLKLQKKFGMKIEATEIEKYEKVKEIVDLESIFNREKMLKHDVKARIEEFNALANSEVIHIGLTSRDVTENVELIQIKLGLRVIISNLSAILGIFCKLIKDHKSTYIVARTHNKPAQLTTLGKRYSDYAEELLSGLQEIEHQVVTLPFRGLKGATGTQTDLASIFSQAEIIKMEKLLAERFGFSLITSSTGQIYPRSIDAKWSSALLNGISSINSYATTFRLMSGFDLIDEIKEKSQVGSSAMPHKNNPRTAERINGLMEIARGFQHMLQNLSGNQWNEGDVYCSVVRRVAVPNLFYAIDGITRSALFLLENSVVNSNKINEEITKYLPQIISSKLLIELTKQGMGRESAHKLVSELIENMQDNSIKEFRERILKDTNFKISSSQIDGFFSGYESLVGNAVLQSETMIERLLPFEQIRSNNYFENIQI